jgi:hypothetical protein
MMAIITDNYSGQTINCSIKSVVDKDTYTRYEMDSKKCNVCQKSQFDPECSDYKVYAIEIYNSGNTRVWAKYTTARGNWSQGGQCVDAEVNQVII